MTADPENHRDSENKVATAKSKRFLVFPGSASNPWIVVVIPTVWGPPH
jgi:hypothetical protein